MIMINILLLKITSEDFAARLAQANFESKIDIDNSVKKTIFDDKLQNLNKEVTSNKSKAVLFENELKKLQAFDAGLFNVQNYFFNDGVQLYLIFQPLYYTLKAQRNT